MDLERHERQVGFFEKDTEPTEYQFLRARGRTNTPRGKRGVFIDPIRRTTGVLDKSDIREGSPFHQ